MTQPTPCELNEYHTKTAAFHDNFDQWFWIDYEESADRKIVGHLNQAVETIRKEFKNYGTRTSIAAARLVIDELQKTVWITGGDRNEESPQFNVEVSFFEGELVFTRPFLEIIKERMDPDYGYGGEEQVLADLEEAVRIVREAIKARDAEALAGS